jgi:hypothetical protein
VTNARQDYLRNLARRLIEDAKDGKMPEDACEVAKLLLLDYRNHLNVKAEAPWDNARALQDF